MSNLKKVGVVFGGKSGEHEVSLVSAESVIKHIPRDKYEVFAFGIDRAGKWLYDENPLAKLKTGEVAQCAYMPPSMLLEMDIIFPVLHGTFGEDGKIQGLCEMLNLPYVGANVLASALGMDKAVSKNIWSFYDLPQVPYLVLSKSQIENGFTLIEEKCRDTLKFPYFVKPANLGSSVGVTKVKELFQLKPALENAFAYDQTAIIEQGVDAREIEIGVLGNFDDIQASLPGEILVAGEFYDFNDKYVDGKSSSKIVDDFTQDQLEYVKDLAIRAFKAIKGSGFARVDLFLERKMGTFFLNEINTIPGFTSISMFPKVWAASGRSYADLLNTLIELGFEYFSKISKNRTSFSSGSNWYK